MNASWIMNMTIIFLKNLIMIKMILHIFRSFEHQS